jgi:cytochrome P450
MTETLSRYWMFTDDFIQDPHPILARLRAETPVCRVDTPDGLGIWVITRYADAKAALADLRLSRDVTTMYQALSRRTGRTLTPATEIANHLANVDPPRHTPLRKALSFAFTPKRAEGLRPRVEQITDDLLDDLAGQDPADLVTGLAEPLPIIAISELMGVPPADWPNFLRWSLALRGSDPASLSGGLNDSTKALSDYMSTLIADKHKNPGDDLLSALVHADEERRLTDSEILSTGFALMTGGNDTTASLLGGVLLAMLTHPQQRALLLAEPARWQSAIEELIRYVSPITNALQRVTTEPVEIGGVLIPKDEFVLVSVMSTTRDGGQYPDAPDQLDITRPKPPHLTFGNGIHFCSGAHLARVITKTAVTRLFTRFPQARLAASPDTLRYGASMVVRPLVSLPVSLGA